MLLAPNIGYTNMSGGGDIEVAECVVLKYDVAIKLIKMFNRKALSSPNASI
jgi:hypothetical protein